MRARDADRNETLDIIGAAYADGQLTREEYDARADAVLKARTLGQLDQALSDLQEPGERRTSAALDRLAQSSAAASDARSSAVGPPRRLGRGVVVLATIGALVVTALMMRGFGDNDLQAVASGGSDPSPSLLTAEGFAIFAAEIEARAEGSMIVSAEVLDDYAVVRVPVDESSDRVVSWTWRDGAFEGGEDAGSEDDPRIDLARIDPATVELLAAEVETRVEEPELVSVTVAADSDRPRQCLRAYASNRFDEAVVLVATCGGKILDTY